MKSFTAGKILLTLTSTWSAAGSYVFDWNDTHISNPEWTPHAKFHNAQSMSMGVFLGVPALCALWGRGPWDTRALNAVALSASGYWVTQLSAALYPGTALFDYARKPKGASGNAFRSDDDPAPPSGAAPKVCGPQPVVSCVGACAQRDGLRPRAASAQPSSLRTAQRHAGETPPFRLRPGQLFGIPQLGNTPSSSGLVRG